MAAENLFVDDGSHRKAVEAVGEHLPELDAVAALALVVEAVDPVDAGGLVVAPGAKFEISIDKVLILQVHQVSCHTREKN